MENSDSIHSVSTPRDDNSFKLESRSSPNTIAWEGREVGCNLAPPNLKKVTDTINDLSGVIGTSKTLSVDSSKNLPAERLEEILLPTVLKAANKTDAAASVLTEINDSSIFSGPPSPSSAKPKRGMRYEELTDPTKAQLRQEILKENLPYASYLYQGVSSKKEGTENGGNITFIDGGIRLSRIKASPAELEIISDVVNEIFKLGFEVDINGLFYHPETGTIFDLVYNNDRQELAVCIRGLTSEGQLRISDEEKKVMARASLSAVVSQAVGKLPKSQEQAIEIGARLKEVTTDTGIKPVFVGHSHGGTIAQAAAISSGSKAVVFNSEPLGSKTKRTIDQMIGKDKRKENSSQVTAFSNRGDWLSGGTINAICRFGRDRGLPVPSVLGKGYQLPQASTSLADNHFCFYDAMLLLKNVN